MSIRTSWDVLKAPLPTWLNMPASCLWLVWSFHFIDFYGAISFWALFTVYSKLIFFLSSILANFYSTISKLHSFLFHLSSNEFQGYLLFGPWDINSLS